MEGVSHRSFAMLQDTLTEDGDRYFALAMDALTDALRACYGATAKSRSSNSRPPSGGGDLLEMLDAAA